MIMNRLIPVGDVANVLGRDPEIPTPMSQGGT